MIHSLFANFYPIPESPETIQEELFKATVGESWLFDRTVQNMLEKLSNAELKKLCILLAKEAISRSDPTLAERLIKNISLERMVKAFEIADLETAMECEQGALKFRFEESKGWLKGELKDLSDAFLNFFPNLINAFLFAFTFFDEGRQPDMVWDVYLILEIYAKFLMLPSTLVVALGFMITSTATLWLTAAAVTVVALGGLYGYLRYFRPLPQKLSYDTDNWTLKPFPPAAARAAEIAEMLRYQLGEGERFKRHVLLVGDPGTGKTTLAQAATEELRKQAPEKRVYAVKPGTLTEHSFAAGPAKKLERLKRELGRQAGNGVFFIDEFHSVVAGLGDHLKTVLDERVVSYWGATTKEGFEKIMKDPAAGQALLDRFHIVFLPELAVDQGCAMAFARAGSLRDAIQVEPEAVQFAAAQTWEGYGQPRLACDLIEGALARARQNGEGKGVQSASLKQEYETRIRSYEASPARKADPEAPQWREEEIEIKKLREKIGSLEKAEAAKMEKLSAFRKRAKLMTEVEKALYTAEPNSFIFLRTALRAELQKELDAREKEIGLPLRVTKALVEEELNWRKKNLSK